jgi:alanyl-tRNA synthetase
MTERLYYNEPYVTRFTATVTGRTIINGKHAIILNKTLFYPTSGGQPNDTGTLNGIPVLDVIEHDDDIIHIVEEIILDEIFTGEIDWQRRFDFMQQHTGQHILSQVILQLFNAETVSFSLDTENATIEINRTAFSYEDALQAEKKANHCIHKNVPVHILYPSKTELSILPLRKKPPLGKPVRVIHIEGLDYSACGGTHCALTGEVGVIKIRRWEKIRGNIRLEFLCGQRAVTDYHIKNRLINELTALFSVPESALLDSAQNAVETNKTLHKTIFNLKQKLFTFQAKNLYITSSHFGTIPFVFHTLEDGTIQELQFLAQAIRSQGTCIVILVCGGEKPAFLCSRTDDIPVDLSGILNELKQTFTIKGGGTPSLVQGGLPSETEKERFITALKERITANLTH